ncbi:MAG: hypothetical protein RLZZ241_1909 [Bacteroidota bacterium]|jgi:Tol biopolymer transport system component
MRTLKNIGISLLTLIGTVALGQRVPVLPQIELPHDYYFRELYLPQLMSGPATPDWSPDGKELVYAMGGSLWRQEIGSEIAYQLTDAIGYDYQPDWSPDGKHIVFVRYIGSSVELMLLDLISGNEVALTQNGAVNLEPVWSPSGKEIAFVSTLDTGHFLLHTAEISNGQLAVPRILTPDRKSEISRYYYSAYDHAINPVWSPKGDKIIFVSNREVAHGSGNIVSISPGHPEELTTIHTEETSWKTAPDIASDGSRLVYSSYVGRNWQQLFMLPVSGGYPIQITYGEYDNTSPKWSPNGEEIAFISNRSGNTSLWIINSYFGQEIQVMAQQLVYLKPHRELLIQTVDNSGAQVPARISVLDSRGRFYAPRTAWIQADDSRYPNSQNFESHYFHSDGIAKVPFPTGEVPQIKAQRGPDFKIATLHSDVPEVSDSIVLTLEQWDIPEKFGTWWSGDLHVHMNYTGSYRNTPSNLRRQARAEHLDFIYNLLVNKEQRIPDIDLFTPPTGERPKDEVMLLQGQEYHSSYWGHLGLLNLTEHYLMPDYVGYPYTALSSIYPHNSKVAEVVHRQNGLVGYVHPFYDFQVFPTQSPTLIHALPVDAALGNVDYYEAVGFAHAKASAEVWHKLLNCGIRIPVGAGTDAMANYASLRGPVGLNRIYVPASGEMTHEKVIDAIRDGRSYATNGALLGFRVNEAAPGDSLEIGLVKRTLQFEGFMRSSVPVDHLEVLHNGKVIWSYRFTADRNTADFKGSIRVKGPGWLLLRAWNENAHPDVLDYHPYATTSPIYLTASGTPLRSKSDALFFLEWIERIAESARQHQGYRSESEKSQVLADIAAGRAYYQNCLDHATQD